MLSSSQTTKVPKPPPGKKKPRQRPPILLKEQEFFARKIQTLYRRRCMYKGLKGLASRLRLHIISPARGGDIVVSTPVTNSAAYMITAFLWRIGHERRVQVLHQEIMVRHKAARLVQRHVLLFLAAKRVGVEEQKRRTKVAKVIQRWWRRLITDQRRRCVRLEWYMFVEVDSDQKLLRRELLRQEMREWVDGILTAFRATAPHRGQGGLRSHEGGLSLMAERRAKEILAEGCVERKRLLTSDLNYAGSPSATTGVARTARGVILAQQPLRHWYSWYATADSRLMDVSVERLLLREVHRRATVEDMYEETRALLVRTHNPKPNTVLLGSQNFPRIHLQAGRE